MESGEFYRKFCSDVDCASFIFGIRWKDGLRCPNCNFDKMYVTGKGLVKCDSCNYSFPVTEGTLLQHTNTKLQKCFRAIWYASTVQHPGKITTQKYQEILETKNNRSAISIKHIVDTALSYRMAVTPLTGIVDISLERITIKDKRLYLVIAGELENRKVLRFWAEIYPQKPEDLTPFVKKYVKKTAILSYIPGLLDKNKLSTMKYKKIKNRKCTYQSRTIQNFSAAVVSYLQKETRLSEANRNLQMLCSSMNSVYTPIPFDTLIKAIIDPQSVLPPSIRKKQRASE